MQLACQHPQGPERPDGVAGVLRVCSKKVVQPRLEDFRRSAHCSPSESCPTGLAKAKRLVLTASLGRGRQLDPVWVRQFKGDAARTRDPMRLFRPEAGAVGAAGADLGRYQKASVPRGSGSWDLTAGQVLDVDAGPWTCLSIIRWATRWRGRWVNASVGCGLAGWTIRRFVLESHSALLLS